MRCARVHAHPHTPPNQRKPLRASHLREANIQRPRRARRVASRGLGEVSVIRAHDYPVRSGCGLVPVSDDLPVGARLVKGSQPEQGLKGGHRGAAAVVAEDKLVEIGLQVLGRDAAVGALQPGLQVGGGAMGRRLAIRIQLRPSRRRVPTKRPAMALAFGASTGVRMTLTPPARKTSSKAYVNFTNRSIVRGAGSAIFPAFRVAH
jgi:hypothetical protein